VRAQRTEIPELAIAAGHQGAIEQLLAQRRETSLSDGPSPAIRAFCVSEERGPHPRWIHTRLAPSGQEYRMIGTKRWATMSPLAHELLVAASVGTQGDRNCLRLVRIPATRAGIAIEPMTEHEPASTSSRYTVPHATITFDQVLVHQHEIFPGDAYHWAIKPFRTLEDIFIPCALLASLLAAGIRRRVARTELETIFSYIVLLHALSVADASDPAVHIALGGVRGSIVELWKRPSTLAALGDLPVGWHHPPGFLNIANTARATRRERAWTLILEDFPLGDITPNNDTPDNDTPEAKC
jgi:hypothetical protein